MIVDCSCEWVFKRIVIVIDCGYEYDWMIVDDYDWMIVEEYDWMIIEEYDWMIVEEYDWMIAD